MEAYCVKCRTKREMKDPVPVTMKNGKPATKGNCPVCGCGMYKIGASKQFSIGLPSEENPQRKSVSFH